MKAKKVNEALGDYIKGKSQEEIKKILNELTPTQKIDVAYDKDIDWLMKEGIEELKKIKHASADDKLYKIYSGLDAFVIEIDGYAMYPYNFEIIAKTPEMAKAEIQILLYHLKMQKENYVDKAKHIGEF